MKKERIIQYLALTKMELGTSEQLYRIMDELDIDYSVVDGLRDLLDFLVGFGVLIFTEEVNLDEAGWGGHNAGFFNNKK